MLKKVNGGVCAAKGYTANGIHCGIRRNKSKRDLALIYSETPASAAAVYTQTTDVEVEVNGLITYDRKVVKVDPACMAIINKSVINE